MRESIEAIEKLRNIKNPLFTIMEIDKKSSTTFIAIVKPSFDLKFSESRRYLQELCASEIRAFLLSNVFSYKVGCLVRKELFENTFSVYIVFTPKYPPKSSFS